MPNRSLDSSTATLRGKYQCYTQANLSTLRATGCEHKFADVPTGVLKYVQWLSSQT